MDADNIEFRLLDSAYNQGLLNIAMTAVFVPVSFFLMAGLIPVDVLKLWATAQFVNVTVGATAYGIWHFTKGSVRSSQFLFWQVLFVFVTLVGGIAWSVGPVLLLPRAQGAELAIYVGMLFIVCAFCVATMAGQPRGMYAFFLGALVPAAWVSWNAGNDIGRSIAVLLLCCLGALIIAGTRSGKELRDGLKLQAKLHEAMQVAGAAREEAEATSLAKSRFLANMSHELRSPLNAVIGAAQLLKAEGDAETKGQLVDAIQRSGKNLLGLIENILDISRIEAGELHLVPRDFHLTDCVDTALATASLAAQAKGLALACIVEPGLPPWRHGDSLRLRQILLNLLGNAIKFTPKGDVVLRVQRGPQEGDVHISVTDTGVGIDAASLPHVFEAFRQADDASNRRFGGSGLGLSIVHQLVVAMGGHVSVQSQLGQGSCFELDLNLPTAKSVPLQPESLGIPIAYFEPHEPSALALEAQLAQLGCLGKRVRTAGELRQWLERLDPVAGQPWLLLACDSPQALEVLEGAVDGVDPGCVIGMTRGEALGAGAVGNLLKLPRNIVKPVLRAELVSRLGTLRRKPSTQPMTMPASLDSRFGNSVGGAFSGASGLAEGVVQTSSIARILVVEDDALNQLIVCRLLSHGGYKTTSAHDGAQALALMAAETFDLVLMDWQMPDMDGLEVTRRLRAGQSGAAGLTIPIVALTANAFAEDRDACLSAGMNDFLTKPVQSELLLKTVQRWTGSIRQELLAPMHRHPEIATEDTRPPAFDPAVMAALPMVADGSEPQYAQELIAMFTESMDQTLRDITQCMEQNDLVKLRRVLHSLKSSSATVGAMELATLAEAHEAQLRQGQPPAPDLRRIMAQAITRLHQALP